MTEEEWAYNSRGLHELEAFGIQPPKSMTQEAFDDLTAAAWSFDDALNEAVGYGLARSTVPFAKRTRTLERDTQHLRDWIEAVRDFDPELAASRHKRPTPEDAHVKAAFRQLFEDIRDGRDFGTADYETIIFQLIDQVASPPMARPARAPRGRQGQSPVLATSPTEWIILTFVLAVVFIGLLLFIGSQST